MDYQKVYDSLINDRRLNPPVGYSERHHIVPRSLGGGDEESNLIALTPRDHFYAHLLLAHIHGGTQWCSVIAMNMSRRRKGANFALAAHQYAKARMEFSAAMTGRKHTAEAKAKIGAAGKGRAPWNKGLKTKGHKNYTNRRGPSVDGAPGREGGWFHTDDTKAKMSKAKTGRKYSEEHRRKISEGVKRKHAESGMGEKIAAKTRAGHARGKVKRILYMVQFLLLLDHLVAATSSCEPPSK